MNVASISISSDGNDDRLSENLDSNVKALILVFDIRRFDRVCLPLRTIFFKAAIPSPWVHNRTVIHFAMQ